LDERSAFAAAIQAPVKKVEWLDERRDSQRRVRDS
jgi:hypothetical protein